MILPFSQKINGKPTYFVERIWKGLKENLSEILYLKIASSLSPDELIKAYKVDGDAYSKVKPKLHTIRSDQYNRWKVGKRIHFFINARQKNMYEFAPSLPVVNIQLLEILYFNSKAPCFTGEESKIASEYYNEVQVIIDDKTLKIKEIAELAQNDGFETVEEFFAFFYIDFSGKLIHWTDKLY